MEIDRKSSTGLLSQIKCDTLADHAKTTSERTSNQPDQIDSQKSFRVKVCQLSKLPRQSRSPPGPIVIIRQGDQQGTMILTILLWVKARTELH